MGRFTGLIGLVVILGVAFLVSTNRKAITAARLAVGIGAAVRLRFPRAEDGFREALSRSASIAVNALLEYAEVGQPSFCSGLWAKRADRTA